MPASRAGMLDKIDLIEGYVRKAGEQIAKLEEALRLKEQECEELRRELETARIYIEELEKA